MRILNVPYLVFDAAPRWQHKAANCCWLERHVVINVTLIIVLCTEPVRCDLSVFRR